MEFTKDGNAAKAHYEYLGDNRLIISPREVCAASSRRQGSDEAPRYVQPSDWVNRPGKAGTLPHIRRKREL